jgi:triacylglycerol lipase
MRWVVIVGFLTIIACSSEKPNNENVILIHGMGRSAASMALLKNRLEKAGYGVLSESYSSTDGTVKDHVAWLDEVIERSQSENRKTHFVTHSLGGIVLRMYLKTHTLANPGRVVMLSPPNKGSELADVLKTFKIYQQATGPSGLEIGTGPNSTPNVLGPVNFDLGVITGDFSFNPVFSLLIPGPDDGKVSVARAKVAGMKDFLVVKHSHTFIMNSKEVVSEVVSFLQTGSFLHKADGN